MQKINQEILFSASDLTFYSECKHRSWLDRLNLDSPMEKTEDDEQSMLIQSKGYQHEASFFLQLKKANASWTEIDNKQSLEKRIADTKQAIDDGIQVIFQGSLRRGNLIGHSDFLLRLDQKGSNGQWLYEVADTKLARTTKAKFILQLCFYSDLLSDITGELPRLMHVELGSGKRETFRTADYIYYYRQLLIRFNEFLALYPNIEPPYPAPCDHCSLCHWRNRCSEKRIADDHLSGVANIRRQQIYHLENAGINTLEKLANTSLNAQVPKLPFETFQKLKHQALLQLHERTSGEQKVEILPIAVDEVKGFKRLPRPDSGDIFFDMEGNPMHDGGLEYLFGVYYFEDGLADFKAFWGHDREEERKAFIAFMDFVEARISKYPKMHIYHYANYENAALKRLMNMHGVKEKSVDDLLRNSRLVDLFKVVSEGIRVSKSGYSIKDLEAFYTDKRAGDVKKATDSIVVYEKWCESRDQNLLESIRQYNEDDCRSTWQLREWLLNLRPMDIEWHSSTSEIMKDKSDLTKVFEERLANYHQRLITNPENLHLDKKLAGVVDSVLDFYRRADKPAWWALYERQDTELNDLLDDTEVIAGLHDPVSLGENLYQYSFPEQDFKLRDGSKVTRLDNLKEVGLKTIDEENCKLILNLNLKADEELPSTLSISVAKPLPNKDMQNALFNFADSIINADGRFKAVQDYLLRKTPDISGHESSKPILNKGEVKTEEIISTVLKLNNSYLFIQGPPGTGKTYTGSHIIAELLKQGKTVAISSNSHKAINNLVSAVDKRMIDSGETYFGVKKVSKEDDEINSRFISNVYSNTDIVDFRPFPQLLAGTAWLLSKQQLLECYDYLFIDEAGQVSLANTIAMGMCAKNLILLGDQMQLGQPIQGNHPGESGKSALEYLLDGKATISPEMGIFLEKTYRMHPDVCRFISDAIYDSQLSSDSSTFIQRLVLNENAHSALKSTGISYLPVIHDGCSQRSEQEAALVKDLVDSLLEQKFVDERGSLKRFSLEDILIVAPYNLQVNLLKKILPEGSRVGTVDKFQGQEAQVVIVSMTTSSEAYLPRFIDFLFSKNRLNVAISRAKCLSVVIINPELQEINVDTPTKISLLNLINKLSVN